MKATQIRPGMIVQYRAAYSMRYDDIDTGSLFIGEVIDTGLYYTSRYDRNTTHLTPDGTTILGVTKTKPSYRPGQPVHAVRPVKFIFWNQPDETFNTADDGVKPTLVRSADVLREWTPEVEKTALASRAEHRQAATAAKINARNAAAKVAADRNAAMNTLRELLGDQADTLLPEWARHDATRLGNQVQGGAGTLDTTALLAIVEATRPR